VGGAKRRPRCFARFRQRMQRFFGCTAFGGAHCFFAKKQVQNPVQYKMICPKDKKNFCFENTFCIIEMLKPIIISKLAEMAILAILTCVKVSTLE